MSRKINIVSFVDGFWGRVIVFSVIMFFISLGDAIISDWAPAFIQESMGSSLIMGLVMAFSAVVGFGADLIFPQLLRGVKMRRLISMGIGTFLILSGILLWSTAWPIIVLFLTGMAFWGVYYEFLGFGNHQFVASIPAASRSAVWSILGVFKSLAYFLGPVIGSAVALTKGNYATVVTAAAAVLVGYLVFTLMNRKTDHAALEPVEKLSILSEIKHWGLLFKHVWPVLILSLVMGLVDATFWTTGTVLSDNLAKINWWGGMFLPLYMLPMIFVGLIVARWGIYKGKKKMAEIFMLLSGLCLGLIGMKDSLPLMLAAATLTGVTLSVAWPLTDAVYSDIISRMGKEGKHMMGLSSSTLSLAYIIGPIFAGIIAQMVGERMTFSVMGIFMAVVAGILLIVTPKKLKLPQTEIQTWD